MAYVDTKPWHTANTQRWQEMTHAPALCCCSEWTGYQSYAQDMSCHGFASDTAVKVCCSQACLAQSAWLRIASQQAAAGVRLAQGEVT